MTIEERKQAILARLEEEKNQEERLTALEESNTVLMECILEMSEIVYA